MFNIQPGNSTGRKSVPQSVPDHSGWDSICGLVARVGQTALLLFIVGAFFHTYIKIDTDVNTTSSEIERVNRQIRQVDREISGLKMDYANCTTREFIDRQIVKFELPLQEIPVDQQSTIVLRSNDDIARFYNRTPATRRVAMNNSGVRR